MEIKFRNFTEQDWYSYSGADVKDGSPEIADAVLPLEGKMLECQIVVDDNGINLVYYDAKEDCYHDFQFDLEGEGVARAKAVLALLHLDNPAADTSVQNLIALGFIYNKV